MMCLAGQQVTAELTLATVIVLLVGVDNVLSECTGYYSYRPPAVDVERRCIRRECTYGFEAHMCEFDDETDQCILCEEGNFQDQAICSSEAIINNPAKLCKPWTICSGVRILMKKGTATNNTVCICDISRCYFTSGPECFELQPKCPPGSTLLQDSNTCQPCNDNTFKNESGCEPCHNCTICVDGIEKNCTKTNDTVCINPSALMSDGGIVGIIVGIIAALVLMYLLIRWIYWQSTQSKQSPESQEAAYQCGKFSCCGKVCYICSLPHRLCRWLFPCCQCTPCHSTTSLDPALSNRLISEPGPLAESLEQKCPTAMTSHQSITVNMDGVESRNASTSTESDSAAGDDYRDDVDKPVSTMHVDVIADNGNTDNSGNNGYIGNNSKTVQASCDISGELRRKHVESCRKLFLESPTPSSSAVNPLDWKLPGPATNKQKMHKKYADSLLENGYVLVRQMVTGAAFLANLRRRSTLTQYDTDEIKRIKKQEGQQSANDSLLRLISERGDPAFELLVDSLVKDERFCLAKLLDVELYEKYKKETSVVPGLSNHDKHALNEVRSLLIESMICNETFLSMCLKPTGFLTEDMKERLQQTHRTKEDVNGKFLNYFECWTDDHALEKLMQLLNDSHQEHVAEKIRTARTAVTALDQQMSESLPPVSIPIASGHQVAECLEPSDEIDTSSSVAGACEPFRDGSGCTADGSVNDTEVKKLEDPSVFGIEMRSVKEAPPQMCVPKSFEDAFDGKRSSISQKLKYTIRLLDLLQDQKLITREDRDRISKGETEADKIERLLTQLSKADDKKVGVFLDVLKEDNQQHVVDTICEPSQLTPTEA